jgi:adenylate cyclase
MLEVMVVNGRQHSRFRHEGGSLELGRDPHGEAGFVVDDAYVSRRQLLVEDDERGSVQIENVGRAEVNLADGTRMRTGDVRVLALPVELRVGETEITLGSEPMHMQGDELQTIARPIQVRPGDADPIVLEEAPAPGTLAIWFERLLSVQRAAAGSGEFYRETAKAVVELIGLDCGVVLLYQDHAWKNVARHATDAMSAEACSEHVLGRVLDERRTYFQVFEGSVPSQSLSGVEAVVASPIFDTQGAVVGAVYGSRNLKIGGERRGITTLEAQVIQLLAASVSSGLARLATEAEAVRARIQFEQFFAPDIVRELERDPTLLEGQQRHLTVLFGDLRQSAEIADRLGARETYRLLSDVMDTLTDCLMKHGGVVIDYHGDGLAAMWNAPTEDPHHALRACEAAVEMLAALPALNETWAGTAGCELQLGVGINTGPAQVGNAGSRRIFKYGPLGPTVNLASRVEGATKQLGVPVLLTAETRQRLPEAFQTRRVGCFRLIGVADPVVLHECGGLQPPASWLAARETYEKALECFESGDLDAAATLLQGSSTPDTPSAWLLEQVLGAPADERRAEGVLVLERK